MIETKLLFRNCLTGKRILKYLLSFSRHNEDLIPRVSTRIYPYPITLRIYYQSVHTIGHLPGSSSQQRRANFWCLDQACSCSRYQIAYLEKWSNQRHDNTKKYMSRFLSQLSSRKDCRCDKTYNTLIDSRKQDR